MRSDTLGMSLNGIWKADTWMYHEKCSNVFETLPIWIFPFVVSIRFLQERNNASIFSIFSGYSGN